MAGGPSVSWIVEKEAGRQLSCQIIVSVFSNGRPSNDSMFDDAVHFEATCRSIFLNASSRSFRQRMYAFNLRKRVSGVGDITAF